MSKGRFSDRAKRKAKMSKKRTKDMLRSAHRKNGPVKIYYLPDLEPKAEVIAAELHRIGDPEMPFTAFINGTPCIVGRNAYGYTFDYELG